MPEVEKSDLTRYDLDKLLEDELVDEVTPRELAGLNYILNKLTRLVFNNRSGGFLTAVTTVKVKVPTDLDTLQKLAVMADEAMHKIRLQIDHAMDGEGKIEPDEK